MNRRFVTTAIAALAAVALPTLAAAGDRIAPASAAPESAYAVALTGTLAQIDGRWPRQTTLPVKIWVDRLSSDAEAEHLGDVARAKGEIALQNALTEDSVGRIQIGDRLAVPIAFARRYSDGDGEHLLLIAQRRVAFGEIFRNTRSSDYPYTVFEIDLDPTGHGGGDVLAAARIYAHRDGQVEIRNLDIVPTRLLGVSPLGS